MSFYFDSDEGKTIGIDFDGVLHKSSLGFHDGTIYDSPIEGSLSAIKQLAKKYKIVVYTAKARPDRPLINDKTGVELVEEWLEKHGVLQYVEEVTAVKPRAVCYVDDRAIEFVDWKKTMERINAQNY